MRSELGSLLSPRRVLEWDRTRRRANRWFAQHQGLRDRIPRRNARIDLLRGIESQDFTIHNIDGEWTRENTSAAVDVFYQTPDALYKLREIGYTIKPRRRFNPQKVLAEVLAENMRGVISSRERQNPYSISERIKLTGENPADATIRALHEELFDGVLSEPKHIGKYPQLDELLKKHIIYGEPFYANQPAKQDNPTYRGLAAMYHIHPSTIIFSPGMHIPIEVDNQGVPQKLYELAEGKYINIFVWDNVTNLTKN